MKPSALGKGTYVLIFHVPSSARITVGSLGETEFVSGYYAYVGSAMGGLGPRLRRHLSRKKTVRWHIDYLTVRGTVLAVLVCTSARRLECAIAEGLRTRLASIPQFGSGGCDCPSHLFLAARRETVQRHAQTVVASLDAPSVLLARHDLRRCLDAGRS